MINSIDHFDDWLLSTVFRVLYFSSQKVTLTTWQKFCFTSNSKQCHPRNKQQWWAKSNVSRRGDEKLFACTNQQKLFYERFKKQYNLDHFFKQQKRESPTSKSSTPIGRLAVGISWASRQAASSPSSSAPPSPTTISGPIPCPDPSALRDSSQLSNLPFVLNDPVVPTGQNQEKNQRDLCVGNFIIFQFGAISSNTFFSLYDFGCLWCVLESPPPPSCLYVACVTDHLRVYSGVFVPRSMFIASFDNRLKLVFSRSDEISSLRGSGLSQRVGEPFSWPNCISTLIFVVWFSLEISSVHYPIVLPVRLLCGFRIFPSPNCHHGAWPQCYNGDGRPSPSRSCLNLNKKP